jgi:L-fuculose-phosphate aldolase
MPDSRAKLAAEIVRVCLRLDERGLIAGPDGNVSARLDACTILITPAGLSKARCRAEDLVVVSLNASSTPHGGRPSTELGMHLRIYARRPEIDAIVHAHPPVATAFGVAGESFEVPVLPEIILQLGTVPLVPYAQPGTESLADGMEPYIARHDALLLANHGATTLGRTLDQALQRMESLEHAARIILAARQLGRVNPLAPAAADALYEARRTSPRTPSAHGADHEMNR